MRCLSSAVNLIAVTTLSLTSCLHRCYQWIFNKTTNYFYAVMISTDIFCPKFSFKLITFSKSYARKHKWMFFSEDSVVPCRQVNNWGWKNRRKMFSWEKKNSMDRRCSAVDRRWHERGENKCNRKKIGLLVWQDAYTGRSAYGIRSQQWPMWRATWRLTIKLTSFFRAAA